MIRCDLPVFLAASCAFSQQLSPDWSNPVKTLCEGGVVTGATVTAANLDTTAIMANAGFHFSVA